MKAREIYKKIRKIYMRNILLPIAAIVFPLGLLVFLPFDKVLEPKVVSSTEEAIEAIEEGYEYLEISMTRLIYSGYDYMRDEDVYGQYYYDLVDGKECLFYLLKPENEINRETYIYGVNKKVKVEETNGIFNNMLSMFSNSIGWTEEGVKDITKEYILSEVSYHYNVFLLLYILLLATLIYGVALLIYSFLVIAFPILCPRIIIAYEHSTLKSFLGMHLKVSYTLHLKCSKLMRFHISRKTLEEANSVLDYIRENKPDTLVGYTNENKELVKEIVNSK